MTTKEIYDGMVIDDPKFFELNGYLLMDIGHKTVLNHVKKVAKERQISLSDLSRLVGESRMQINNIAHEKVVPSIEIVLKLTYVLNIPLTELFSLSKESWYIHETDKKGRRFYFNIVDNTIYNSRSKTEAVSLGKFDYFDIQEGKYVDKNVYKRMLSRYKHEHSLRRYQEAGNTMPSNELRNSIAETLEKEFNQRYVQVYKKIVKPSTPIQMPKN